MRFDAVNGVLAGSIGQLIGVEPGCGMGLLAMGTAVSAFAYPRIRHVETELPDLI